MKTRSINRSLLLAALSLALATGLSAQGKKANGAKMEVDPSEHDFGPARQDQKLVKDFTISNAGTEPLEILRIATSCGCTAAVTSERTVAPGQTTILRVTLETRKYRGSLERSVSVASNDPGRVHKIRVRAFVEAED